MLADDCSRQPWSFTFLCCLAHQCHSKYLQRREEKRKTERERMSYTLLIRWLMSCLTYADTHTLSFFTGWSVICHCHIVSSVFCAMPWNDTLQALAFSLSLCSIYPLLCLKRQRNRTCMENDKRPLNQSGHHPPPPPSTYVPLSTLLPNTPHSIMMVKPKATAMPRLSLLGHAMLHHTVARYAMPRYGTPFTTMLNHWVNPETWNKKEKKGKKWYM